MYDNLVELKHKAHSLTTKPGVYLMKNFENKIIYIGKAKNLKNRVSSYFRNLASHNERIKKLIGNVYDFDFIVTDSEFDALILECSLIKQNKPKYNVLLKDSKGFCFIKITTNFKFPKITVVKNKKNDGSTYLGPYVQYSNIFPLKQVVKNINEIFMLPDCNLNLNNISRKRPCLNFYIKKCSGVCCGKISEQDYKKTIDDAIEFLKDDSKSSINLIKKQMFEAADNQNFELAIKLRDRIKTIEKINQNSNIYLKNIDSIEVISAASLENSICFVVVTYFKNKINNVQHFICENTAHLQSTNLKEELEEFVATFYYDKTQNINNMPQVILIDCNDFNIELFSEYFQKNFSLPIKIELPCNKEKFKTLAKMANDNAVEILNTHLKQGSRQFKNMNELAKLLNLKEPLERIEAYDISNLGNSAIVGTMVVFQNGWPLKSNYRKFKMKTVFSQNDYASIGEILKRRIDQFKKGTDSSFSKKPDLILIDGGKGHVSTVKKILKDENFDVPCFGMVKNSKHRTRALTNVHMEFNIATNKSLFYFITKIQDEVHRFTIDYSRKTMQKINLELELTKIKGVGATKAIEFLKYFNSDLELKHISAEKIAKKLNVNLETAKEIETLFSFIS